jgi:uncharacterized repeat protein (TIGR01451 family)
MATSLGAALVLAACGGGSGRYTGTDVFVTGVGPSTPVLGGGTVVFEMTVKNGGPYNASDVTVTNQIGNQLALTGITCTATGGAVCPSLTSVSMAIPSLPAGGTLVFDVNANAVVGANGLISNTMNAQFGDDSDRSNNAATVTASAESNSVAVTATAPTESVVGGAATAFAMAISNAGPATATDVQISNVLSADLSLNGSISCVPSGGAAPVVAMPDGTLLAPSIPSGGALACTVPVIVTAGANGRVSSTMTATAAGDQRAVDNDATAYMSVTSSDLSVSQSSDAQIGGGTSAKFTAVVANAGPGGATNVNIQWTHTDAPGLTFAAPTCTATGGAVCPTTLGPSMSVPSLSAGRSLTFKFSVDTADTFRGPIVNTIAISSTEDQSAGNNVVSTTTNVVDARNGSYTTFSADGKPYTMAIDFDAGQYSISGSGVALTRTFVFDPATTDYVVGGNVRFRVASDLLVGGDDFGGGLLPYVAARKFATTVSSIAGSYDLGTRNVPSAATPVSHAGTALVSGNTLSVCQSESVDVVAVRNCSADARKDYLNLTVSGNGFVGRTDTGEVYAFSVAESGALKLLLSASSAPDGSQQLRIGVVDSTGGFTYGPPSFGPSTNGDWLTVTLANAGSTANYTASGTSTTDSASLVTINPGGSGPFSMLVGTSVLYNANIYVMQASPLVVVVGGVLGAASGLMEVTLP